MKNSDGIVQPKLFANEVKEWQSSTDYLVLVDFVALAIKSRERIRKMHQTIIGTQIGKQ